MLMSHSLSLLHISLHRFLSPCLILFLLHCLCHCLHLLLLFFSPMPPAETTDPPASKPVRDFRYVYTHRTKVPASEPVLANPSPVDGPPSQQSTSPFDLDILIALRKGKWSCIDHPISNFVSYDTLTSLFVSLLHLYPLSLYSCLIQSLYWYLPGSRL